MLTRPISITIDYWERGHSDEKINRFYSLNRSFAHD